MDTIEAFGLQVNGQPVRVDGGATVATLLHQLGLDGRKVAVERQEAIVPRSLWAATRLEPGDQLEIVHFIGGG